MQRFCFILVALFMTVNVGIAAEFKFICPENIPTQEERKKHLSDLMDFYMKKNPNAKITDFVEYRIKMLEKHNCRQTLENIKQNNADQKTKSSPSKPLKPIKNIFLCVSANSEKYISQKNTGGCIPYTVPKGWITVMATENNIVDIMPKTVVREKDGVKIWTHFYTTQPSSLGDDNLKYDGVKSISKFYCKKRQTKLIQASYTLGNNVVYERLENEAIMEEIEPGTVNEKIYEYVCK